MPHIVRIQVNTDDGIIAAQTMVLVLPPFPRDDFVREALTDAQAKLDEYCAENNESGYALDTDPGKWTLTRISDSWVRSWQPVEETGSEPVVDEIDSPDGTWLLTAAKTAAVPR